MDYISAPGNVVDAQGRRQFANLIPGQRDGTDLDETVFNPTINEVMHCIEQSGLTGSSNDETQLWQAIAKGRLLRVVDVTSSRTYTPGSDAKSLLVQMQGPGGGGGGALGGSNSSNPAACGSASGAGSWAQLLINLALLPVANMQLTIGAPGLGYRGADGSDGGTTSFGSLVQCNGGRAGTTTGSIAAGKAAWTGQGIGGTVTYTPTTGMQMIHALQGANGSSGFLIPNSDGTTASVPVPPIGPDSKMGVGSGNATTSASDGALGPTSGFGAGAGGTGTVGAGSMTGGVGGMGRILIWELG
ncbi:hypothetical protein [Gluconobacter frateurii]|uniref:Tail fiber protein n=1 Tax=Gluconobacter frateurii NRIC 0228 TaxID=1307946 RepID=A0ABQ0Q943_9PROT|nr:hypothetical protein [Gluconobacter frateurii]GBR09531.1 hypothetical protein AA0228_0708 [Gluconobacter frateurii NRIC 0228]GLP91929.1 hypothetical protein GCM10007868_30040 [Gluconobacter frateurii]